MAGDHISFGNVTGPVQTGDGVQNVSYGDQIIGGDNQTVVRASESATIGSLAEVTSSVEQLRAELDQMRLSTAERDAAARELAGLQAAVDAPDDQRDAAAQHLHAFTAGLKEAGAMASAGSSLVESIGKVARWLGPLGATVLALL